MGGCLGGKIIPRLRLTSAKVGKTRHYHGCTCSQSQWARKDVPKDSNWLRGWYSQGFICCQRKLTSFWPIRCEIKVTTYTGRYTGILTLCPQLLTAWVTWTQLNPISTPACSQLFFQFNLFDGNYLSTFYKIKPYILPKYWYTSLFLWCTIGAQ